MLMTCSGLIFPMESRFETFMNVILFKQIIQDNAAENLSGDLYFFLIRAGMALTITKAWRAFVGDREFSKNVATSMEVAKQKKSQQKK